MRRSRVQGWRSAGVWLGVVGLAMAPRLLSAACTQPPTDLVSWWHGDGSTEDIVGGLSGTLQNGATYGSGQVGSAFRLEGITHYVDLGNQQTHHVSTGPFSVQAWVFFDSITTRPGSPSSPLNDMSIVDKMAPGVPFNSNGWRLIKQLDHRFWFCFGQAGSNGCGPAKPTTVVSSTTAVPGVWYHVAGVRSASEIAIYVNGVKEQSKPLPAYQDTHQTELRIGSNKAEGAFLWGAVDEVQLLERALSSAEVAAVFNAGKDGVCREVTTLSAAAGADISVACDTGQLLAGSAIDPLGEPLQYAWSSSCAGTSFLPGAGVANPVVSFGSECGVSCALTLAAHAGAAGCTPPPSGMVSWWRGDGTARDSAGGNHGALLNRAGFAAGLVGQTLRFDGVDEVVGVANAPTLALSAGDFSVDAWVRFNSLSTRAGSPGLAPDVMSLVDKMAPTSPPNSDGWRLMKQADHRIWFCLGGDTVDGCDPSQPTTVRSTSVATVGAWIHVAAVKSASEIAIYINGSKEQSKPLPGFRDTNQPPLLLGANLLEGAFLWGQLDEVEIFDRALSAAEIQRLVDAGPSGKCKRSGMDTLQVDVDDTIKPVLTGIPSGTVAECHLVPPAASPTATDNCVASPVVRLVESRAPGGCVDQYTLTRKWSASDSCSNTATGMQVIQVDDTTKPVLAGVPASSAVECDAVPPVAPVTASDNCAMPPALAFLQTRVDGRCPFDYLLNRRWTAVDNCGNAATELQVLKVGDSKPPVVQAGQADLYCLWPPNHRYVCFRTDAFAPVLRDNCSSSVSWEITGCASDQPDDSTGDGNTVNDCVVAPDRRSFCVRSERMGGGPDAALGRRYAVAIRAIDECQNTSTPVVLGYIHVPHDRSRGGACLDAALVGCDSPGDCLVAGRPLAEVGEAQSPGLSSRAGRGTADRKMTRR